MLIIDHRQSHPCLGYNGVDSSDLRTGYGGFSREDTPILYLVSCLARKAPHLISYAQPHPARAVGLEVKSPLHSLLSSWWQFLVAFPSNGPWVGPYELSREFLIILSLKRGDIGILILSLLVGTEYVFIKLNFIESDPDAKNAS